jgi:hypothetical protein
MSTSLNIDYPPKADLRNISKPLPKVPPNAVNPESMDPGSVMTQAKIAVKNFNAALSADDPEMLASCFYAEQAYWRDIVALTSHLRTFDIPRVVAAALSETISLRKLVGQVEMVSVPHFTVMSPFMVSSQ